MEKINIGNRVFLYPMPVTLLGVEISDKPNFMTLGWITRLNAQPPLVGVAVNKSHHTNQGIRDKKVFSVNFPSEDLLVKTDYCGLHSGRNEDKSVLFNIFYGELENAPMIEECPLSFECKLEDIYEMPTNDLFIGEIISTYTSKDYLSDGKPDMAKIKPLLLTMPDNRYWSVGEEKGKAWKAGKELKEI
jgi:flavin reductase (DIM6/NTAB) family NADH-FMN oxidoreductase RutF